MGTLMSQQAKFIRTIQSGPNSPTLLDNRREKTSGIEKLLLDHNMPPKLIEPIESCLLINIA